MIPAKMLSSVHAAQLPALVSGIPFVQFFTISILSTDLVEPEVRKMIFELLKIKSDVPSKIRSHIEKLIHNDTVRILACKQLAYGDSSLPFYKRD
jgi:hypothetical protein